MGSTDVSVASDGGRRAASQACRKGVAFFSFGFVVFRSGLDLRF